MRTTRFVVYGRRGALPGDYRKAGPNGDSRTSRTKASEPRDEETSYTRAIECPCGHRFEADDDERLFRLCREHVDRDHPEMQRSDEQIRERIDADAYDAVPA
jgi:hypothetical protein